MAFFAHEFISFDYKLQDDIASFESLKKERNTLRSLALETASDKSILADYTEKQNELKQKFNEIQLHKSNKKFNGFKSFQSFLGEFGWSFGLCIYALFNLVLAYFDKQESRKGKVTLHATLLGVSFYFIAYACLPNLPINYAGDLDYPNVFYLLSAIIATTSVLFSVTLLVKSKKNFVESLKIKIRNLVGGLFDLHDPAKEDEMWDLLDQNSK